MILDISIILGNVFLSVFIVCWVSFLGLNVLFVYLVLRDIGVIGKSVIVLMFSFIYFVVFCISKLIESFFILGIEGMVFCVFLLGSIKIG